VAVLPAPIFAKLAFRSSSQDRTPPQFPHYRSLARWAQGEFRVHAMSGKYPLLG
jgi:hypothetical protein